MTPEPYNQAQNGFKLVSRVLPEARFLNILGTSSSRVMNELYFISSCLARAQLESMMFKNALPSSYLETFSELYVKLETPKQWAGRDKSRSELKKFRKPASGRPLFPIQSLYSSNLCELAVAGLFNLPDQKILDRKIVQPKQDNISKWSGHTLGSNNLPLL